MPQPAAVLPHASPDYDRTLVLAIELSSKSWVLAAQVPGLAQVKAKRTIEPTKEALLGALASYRDPRQSGGLRCTYREEQSASCDQAPESCLTTPPGVLASDAAFRRETMTEVELISGGLAVSLPGDRPAMLRGLSLRHEGPAVLIVDEASRVRDELWATISPMLAAAPAAQQILLSTPAGASGEFYRVWSSGEDWERVQITADQCPRISASHLAAERVRLGDALYRQEYFGAFVSAPGSVFDAEVLAHMFGDHAEDEPDVPAAIVQGRIVDRFLQ